MKTIYAGGTIIIEKEEAKAEIAKLMIDSEKEELKESEMKE
jgi:hypothetical protein